MSKEKSRIGGLKELAALFLRLGFTAFGGPAAHIAMMEDEVVVRRRWMSREHFLDLVGATNLIPGPNSTEMAIHVGFHRAGWKGLLVAGVCFILPASLITLGFAWFYVQYGQVPQVAPFLFGIKPAVLAIIIAAVWRLGQSAAKSWQLAVIGLVVAGLAMSGVNEVLAILTGGIIGMAWLLLMDKWKRTGGQKGSGLILTTLCALSLQMPRRTLALVAENAATIAGAISLAKLGLIFLKIGSVLFGSGYVLVAYLDGELVQGLGWLSRQQLLDAIAIGQFTPGPVLSTATFIGYVIQGGLGALVATAGIFLPSFIFVVLLNPLVPKLRKSRISARFLDAVNVSAVGLMAAVLLMLGSQVLLEWKAGIIFVPSAAMTLFWRKVGSGWIIAGGALLGYLLLLI